ncbi:MAG: hypothetical protein JSC161_000524 [Candidatus Tokpelaia sp. JSC161]|nr:MAG: hypothetical protein JSC161_000524 [Candidatus Tokpelaia sp. JSC161]
MRVYQSKSFLIISTTLSIAILYFGYSYLWNQRKAAYISHTFLQAHKIANQADYDAAMIKLDEVKKSRFATYPTLAQMREASILVKQNKPKCAVAIFDAVATNPSTPTILKDIASIRSAYILVDIGSFTDVEQHVRSFIKDNHPLHFAAEETLGLSAWKARKIEDAIYYFKKISQDTKAMSSGFHQRAKIMLNLLYSLKKQGR